MPRRDVPITDIHRYHDYNLFLPTRTIYFGGSNMTDEDDAITSKTVSEVIKNLQILEYAGIAPISLLLNTVGGSWEDGIAVYDVIKSLQSPVNIIGIGKVYSMGSVILQAGKKRTLTQNTYVLIHDGTEGYVGDSKSFEKWAKVSKHTRKVMYEIYYQRMKQKNPNITLKQIENICNHDMIYTAEQALEIGLADQLINNSKKG